ncbi:putative ribonuclease H-like domain-containing protein [Tanacetum coccineum]
MVVCYRPMYTKNDNVNQERASYSPIKRSYYTKPAFRPKDLKKDVKTSGVKNMTTARTRAVVNTGKGKMDNDLKKSRWVWRPKGNYMDHESKEKGSFILKKFEYGNPESILQDHYHHGDSVASSHNDGDKANVQTNRLQWRLRLLEVIPKEFNLFSVSQMCDKKNSVLFTDTECLILSPSFKLLDESQVVLRAPRQNGVYSLDLKNIVPSRAMNELCAKKGINREFSMARTPQQNGVAERKNRTLIEAARTMLADSLLPIPFWAKAVNTACYVLNRVLVTKPQNKTPYELLIGKFDGKSNEGYLLGYSTTSKAFRVYNKRTKRVEENMHIDFLEDQLNVAGSGPDWMFDLDFLTNTMNYIPVSVENQVNVDAVGFHRTTYAKAMDDVSRQAFEEEKRRIASQKKAAQATSTNKLSTDRPSVSTDRPSVSTDRPFVSTDRSSVSTDRSNTPYVSAASTSTGANAGESSFVYLGGKIPIDASTLPNADLPIDPNMPDLEDASDTLPNDGIFNGAYDDDEDVGAVADFNNMDNTIAVSPIPTLRIHKDHPKGQILGDPTSAVQTRGKIQKASSAQQALVSYIHKQNRTNHKDHQNCLFACFLSQEEPKTISQALQDESWVEAMQEELLQFKLQKVWVLVDLPYGKKVIGTKWVFKNKRDERSIVVKNKARLVAQGFRQEEGIDYDEVFAPVAKIEAIRLFLAFASYMGFTVYQIEVKSAFLYGTIEEEVYVHQPPGFVDPAHPNNVYKFEECMHKRFQMSSMGELTFFLGLQVKQQPDGIFISQDKYVADILKKFDFLSIRTATTPIESNKPLIKDEDGVDVDVHVYRFMIGSLMYLTASRPDIMFAVCTCARFQQTIVANSTTEAKYVVAANCCGQVLWIQNQMMDYGFNFMNTKIHIDNESTISVIKNPVVHSRTKHIEIRFYFIRDCYEKRLIEVIKIHTDSNMADLLTKGFDVTRFNFLVVSIGMLNL